MVTGLTDKLGVAIIGCGEMGEKHLQAYLKEPRCEIRWLCDMDLAKALILAYTYGVPADRCVTEAGRISESPETHIVSIATYDNAHAIQVIAALLRGQAVFCEKPLVYSQEEWDVLYRTWRDTKRPLVSHFPLRTVPAFTQLRKQIQRGAFGDIFAVEGTYLWGRLYKLTDGWRREILNYSVMLGGGIHLVDLLCWLTGQYPETVTASGNGFCTALSVNDYVTATFQFPSGMIGGVTCNFGAWHSHAHHVHVWGTKGTFLSDGTMVTSYDDGKLGLRGESPRIPEEPLLIHAFVQAVAEGKDLSKQTEHDLRIVAVCLAADEAVATGASVPCLELL